MAELVKDVVCGMDVDPDTAPANSVYGGQTYYFCAVGCKKDFDEAPQKYLAGAASGKKWWEFWK